MSYWPKVDALHLTERAQKAPSGLVLEGDINPGHVLQGVGITYGHAEAVQAADAVLCVTRYAVDDADRARLLEALGLNIQEPAGASPCP